MTVKNFTPYAGQRPAILIWHSYDSRFDPRGVCVPERVEVPEPGMAWDFVCPDCPNELIEFGGVPEEVAVAAYGMAHDPTCPWLLRVRIERGAR